MNGLRPGILLVALALIGCQPGLLQPRTRLESEGAVYLYLDPLAPEAERLRAGFSAVSALNLDGRQIPLSLSLREFAGEGLRRQRLLASGPLPAGEYTGFAFVTKSASLKGEEGESSLLVPDTPSRADFRFTVRRGEASVVALALRYGTSVGAGFSFNPVFSIYTPDRPPVGLMGFVANRGSSDVTVFDKKSLRVFDVIATGRRPTALALDPRSQKVYVALSAEDGVDVIDVLSGRVTDRIRLTPGDEPVALALAPDGGILLAANRQSNTVSLIEARSNVELTKVRVGDEPRSIAISRDGRRAFTFNARSNTISVIDVLARSVIASIPTDPTPVRGDFNRRGDRLFVIHETASYVTVVNPLTLVVAGRFPIRSGMDAIKVDPNTDLVYLGTRHELAVGVHEALSLGALDFFDVGAGVVHMATDGEENTLYVVSPDTDRVRVIHRIRRRLAGELDVGDGPVWVAVAGEN